MKGIFIHKDNPHVSSNSLCNRLGIKDAFCFRRELRNPYPFTNLTKALLAWDIFLTYLKAPLIAKRLKNYDIYFFEGLSSPLIRYVKRSSNKILAKGNSHEPFFFERSRLWEIFYKKFFNLDKNLDALIAVSEMIKEDFEKKFNFRIEVEEGFTSKDYKKLSSVSPDFDNKNFIFINCYSHFKGVETSVDVFLKLKMRGMIPKGAKFFLVGDGNKENLQFSYDINYLIKNGVVFVGYTDNIERYLEKSLFHLHLALYEPNAVSVMEGMMTGHIPIVSHKTGNKTFISKINKDLVMSSFDVDSIVKRMEEVMDYDERELKKLSRAFKIKGKRYSKEEGLKRWHRTWKRVLC